MRARALLAHAVAGLLAIAPAAWAQDSVPKFGDDPVEPVPEEDEEQPEEAPERELFGGTLSGLADAHDHVDTVPYGSSYGGSALMALRVRNPSAEQPIEWLGLVIAELDGLVHSRQKWIVPDLANWLAEHAEEIPAGTAFLLVPRPSPDSLRDIGGPPAAGRASYARVGNGRPVDEDQDGDTDEDGPDDLDGDGHVSWMRFPDPTGQLSVTPTENADDPSAPEFAAPEKGKPRTHRIVREGRDDDGDGLFNEDGLGSVNVSRNFPWGFEEHTPAAGAWHASEPETRALMDLLLADERIALVYEFGAAETIVKMPGWKGSWQKLPEDDTKLYAALRELHGKGAKDVERREHAPGAGSFGGTVIHQLGRIWLGRAPLGWSGPAWPAEGARWPTLPGDDGKPLPLTIDWQPVTGAGVPAGAEVGNVEWRDADPELVAESEAAAAFLLEAARGRARLALTATEATGSAGVLRLRTKIVNTGRLPTHTARGAELRARRPINVRVRLPDGAKLLAGKPHSQIERLAGGEASGEMAWVVAGPAGATVVVEVASPDCGTVEHEERIP